MNWQAGELRILMVLRSRFRTYRTPVRRCCTRSCLSGLRQSFQPRIAKFSKRMKRHRKFLKSLVPQLGPLEVEWMYFRRADCGCSVFPLDRALGITGQTMMPGAASIVTDAVVSDSFAEASRKLRNPSRDNAAAMDTAPW